MRNNLAEILDIHINPDLLYLEWLKQIEYSHGYCWLERNYVEIEFFTSYFQILLETVNDLINEEPKNYVLQCHDKSLIDDKWYLNIAHKDDDRKTCITIPLIYSRMETINFYDDDADIPQRGKPITTKPSQVGWYSEKHPTLVNVNNYHNVRVLSTDEPRVLLQLSYDLTFEEIISKQINTNII